MKSEQQLDPRGGLDSLVHYIYAAFAAGEFPKHCLVCEAFYRMVLDVRIDHDDFELTLPVRACPSCAKVRPFTSRSYPPIRESAVWTLVVGGLFLLGQQWILAAVCLIAAVGIVYWQRRNFRKVAQARPATLKELLKDIPPYETVLEQFEDVSLTVCSPNERLEDEPPSEARRFASKVLFRRQYSILMTDDEIRTAGLPPVILESYLEMIEGLMERVIRSFANPQPAILQVGVTLLPNRRIEFDVTAATQSRSPRTLCDPLKSELKSIPAWPVAYPVVFAVQRIWRTPSQSLYSKLSPPFAAWLALASREVAMQETTPAQLAIQFYDISPATEPVAVELEDCDAICAGLPESIPLKFYRAWLLRTWMRFEESLAMYEKLRKEHAELEEDIDVERAWCLAETGQFEHAAAICQQLLGRNPDNSNVLGLLAQIQLDLNQPEKAFETIEKVVSDRHAPAILQIRAVILTKLEQFDEAMSTLNLAIFQNLDYAPAYLLRAKLYISQSRYEEALSDLDQFERCSGPTFDSLHLKAITLIALRRGNEAEQAYRTLIEQHPENLLLRLQLAEFLTEVGKLESAKQECDTIIDRKDPFGAAFAVRGSILLEMHQFEAAIADADRALELGGEGAFIWLVRGLAKAALGQEEQAFEDLDTCVEIAPDYALARLHRGRLRFQLEEYESAIAELTLVLNLFPDWVDALVERGYAFLGLDQHAEAKDDFQKAIEVSPDCSTAYTGRAITWLIEGNKAVAAEDLDKALTLNPTDITGRMNRVMLLLQKDEAELARADLDEILAVEPNMGTALFQRAHLNLDLGRYEEAKKDFDHLIEINPNVPEAFLGRSVALEQTGDIARAEADQEQARQLAPFSAEELAVSRALLAADIASRNEQFEKAIALATQAIEEHPEPLWNAYRIRGHAQWYSENFVEALEDYAFILDQSEESTRHDWSAYGQVLAEVGEFEQALELLERAIKIAEEEQDHAGLAFSLNGKGRALAGLGRFAEAEKCFSQSLELKPDNAWLHFNRGLMYLEIHEPAKTLECFRLSLRADSPKLPPAKRRRAEGAIRSIQGSSFNQ